MNLSETRAVELSTLTQPGVIISNAWPQSRSKPGATLRAIEQVLEHHPFFEAFQTVDIPTPEERRAVCRTLHDAGHPHTYTLTRILGEQRLNLSSLDAEVRRRSCGVVGEKLQDAREAGAMAVGLISGPRPNDSQLRSEALRGLEESLATIAEAAAKIGIEPILEPLDFDAHKRCTLGTTAEAVGICERLARSGLRVRLCLDVAHLILNRENPVTAVAMAREHISEFHFCNAVTDTANPLHGDHHLFFGPPGVVDIPEIAGIMAGLCRIGYFAPAVRPRIYCEVWKPDHTDSLAVVAHCQSALLAAWESAGRTKESSIEQNPG